MIGYSAREVFPVQDMWAMERAFALVVALDESLFPPLPVRCHELARAVGAVLGLEAMDGFCSGVEHTWLMTAEGNILDVYVPGRLPMVQLVYPSVGRLLYERHELRLTRPVDPFVVDRMIDALRTLG